MELSLNTTNPTGYIHKDFGKFPLFCGKFLLESHLPNIQYKLFIQQQNFNQQCIFGNTVILSICATT